jgi:hypothetical protein
VGRWWSCWCAENQEEARGRTRAGGDNVTSSRILESRPESGGNPDELIREAGKCDGGLSFVSRRRLTLSFVGAEAGVEGLHRDIANRRLPRGRHERHT